MGSLVHPCLVKLEFSVQKLLLRFWNHHRHVKDIVIRKGLVHFQGVYIFFFIYIFICIGLTSLRIPYSAKARRYSAYVESPLRRSAPVDRLRNE